MSRTFARDAVGVGLRPPHFADAFQDPSGVDFFEVIAENYLGTGPVPAANLEKARMLRPVALHGVSLDLLGTDPLDLEHIRRVGALAEDVGAPCFSDHLCWTRLDAWRSHDLLPTPFTEEIADHAARRAEIVQGLLPVPFGIENLSSYAAFSGSTLTEWEFYKRVVDGARVWRMLDINNIFVSARNHDFDPRDYLESVDWDRVLYVHLAGHHIRPDGLRIDTHDAPVCEEVWDLYRDAWALGGPFPTVIEWDDNLPTWARLVEEAASARTRRGSPVSYAARTALAAA
ncbi:MAG TPA: DUF692 domain-containing protein [Fibrobacteria bacterium]|nr:DUF692 domain-containing protein [Fibrobacteria bacterium]